jgi:hypothetical protein
MKLGARHGWAAAMIAVILDALGCGGSGGGSGTDAAAACDQACTDAIAVRALRDAIKLVYNVTLQGKPVGAQDQSTPCPLGGSASVQGQATSNADQGATTVSLTYAFAQCAFSQTDTDPNQTFSVTLTGTVTENGTIAVQPSSTTSLQFKSDAMTFAGTVSTPAVDVAETCAVVLGQSGNEISGTLCGRTAGGTL